MNQVDFFNEHNQVKRAIREESPCSLGVTLPQIYQRHTAYLMGRIDELEQKAEEAENRLESFTWPNEVRV